METYLVVIDSTHMPSAKSLSKNIQNFYFIKANDSNMAKQMVINTFRQRPQIAADVTRCISATPIKAITDLLNERQNVWSYVPIGNVRAPGQQGTGAALQQIERLNEQGRTQEVSHRDYQPPKPETYDAVAKNADDMVKEITPQQPAVDPAMFAQFQAFMQMMGGGAPGVTPALQEQAAASVTITKADPSSDPELAARIRANISPTLEIVPDDDIDNFGGDAAGADWNSDLTSIDP